ncbi:MAG: hypothetical protein OXE78_00150 [Gammaproteobacteria bacterium]|nr:hypothetical protein [Gammaproteobacteria bacterium]
MTAKTPQEKILIELEGLGYDVENCKPDNFGFALALIEYPVKVGRYKGRSFKVGIGFQENAYPEYPPHWLCVASLPDSLIHQHSEFTHNGTQWRVFSAPPSDFWDDLPTVEKNMKSYLLRHMTRFWDQV